MFSQRLHRVGIISSPIPQRRKLSLKDITHPSCCGPKIPPTHPPLAHWTHAVLHLMSCIGPNALNVSRLPRRHLRGGGGYAAGPLVRDPRVCPPALLQTSCAVCWPGSHKQYRRPFSRIGVDAESIGTWGASAMKEDAGRLRRSRPPGPRPFRQCGMETPDSCSPSPGSRPWNDRYDRTR